MKTYYQTIKSKIIYCLAQIAIAVLYIILIKYLLPAGGLQILFIVFGLLGTFLSFPFIMFLGETIAISVEGVEYSKFSFRIKVKWNGFKQIGRFLFREGLFINNGYFLTVKHPLFPDWETRSNFATYFFIPLSSFSDNWRDSELGGQIKQLAPDLFEK